MFESYLLKPDDKIKPGDYYRNDPTCEWGKIQDYKKFGLTLGDVRLRISWQQYEVMRRRDA